MERACHRRRATQPGLEVAARWICRLSPVLEDERGAGALPPPPRNEPASFLVGWPEGTRGHSEALPVDARLPGRRERSHPPHLGLGLAGHEPRFSGIQSGRRLLGYLRFRRVQRWLQPELVRIHFADRGEKADGKMYSYQLRL